MRTHSRGGSAKRTRQLRRQAGLWLRDLREKRGLSQRELARIVGVKFYTFISQIEHGRGGIPPDRYLVWAAALQVEPREFVQGLMSYYHPMMYDVIFGEVPITTEKNSPVKSSTVVRMRKRRVSARTVD
jgi:transcriptional regulator with XRE-family HTH domain